MGFSALSMHDGCSDLVGAEPAESPEGHGAGDWGGGARRLGALTQADHDSHHLHRLHLHAQTRNRPESQRRTAAAAARAFFRPPTHPVFSGIGRGLERGASSMATTGQCWPPHGAWGAGDTCPLPPPLCLLITPTQQPRHQQRRLKALVGAEPVESPEGHGAGACGGGARRLGAESGSWKSSTRPS